MGLGSLYFKVSISETKGGINIKFGKYTYSYSWIEYTHQVSSKSANLGCQNAFRLDDFT